MMKRYVTPVAAMAAALFSAGALAGIVPEQVQKDADAGYYHRELEQIQPLLPEHAQDAEVQFRYGQALAGIGRAEDGIAALKSAIASNPDVGIYHRALGEAYELKAKQLFDSDASTLQMLGIIGIGKSALAEFREAVRLAPEDLRSHVDLAKFYINAPSLMGGSFQKAHEEEDAIGKLDRIAEWQVRGIEAGKKNDIAAGEVLFRQAIAQDRSAESLIAFGLFYTDAERYDEALQVFREARTKDPKAYAAWYQAGRVAGLARNNYEEGIDCLKHYLAFVDLPDTVPGQGWAHLRLGNLYEYRGDHDRAQAEYHSAAMLAADDKGLAAQVRKALRHLESSGPAS